MGSIETIISRYNPHFLQKTTSQKFTLFIRRTSRILNVQSLAACLWNNDCEPESKTPLEISSNAEILEEYGIDAVRIADITSAWATPENSILESSLRWLAAVHDHAMGLRSTEKKWDAAPWLQAAFSAKDHILIRGKIYPALASIRKAWKNAPLTLETPISGLILGFSLLFPFAPILSKWMLDRISSWPPPAIEALSQHFPPQKAVRISIEKGGWIWEVFDSNLFEKNPKESIFTLRWVQRIVKNHDWTIRHSKEGWQICPGPLTQKIGNSRFS